LWGAYDGGGAWGGWVEGWAAVFAGGGLWGGAGGVGGGVGGGGGDVVGAGGGGGVALWLCGGLLFFWGGWVPFGPSVGRWGTKTTWGWAREWFLFVYGVINCVFLWGECLVHTSSDKLFPPTLVVRRGGVKI